jgi:hypothetical protein
MKLERISRNHAPKPAAGIRLLLTTLLALSINGFSPNEIIAASQASSETFAVLFPHYAMAGGYATTFTFLNKGPSMASGVLTLWDASGNVRSMIEIRVSPNGVNSYRVGGSILRDVVTGWARYEGTGGDVTGMATFQYSETGILRNSVGVPSAASSQWVFIPVDNASAASASTAYAIANPGPNTAQIQLTTYHEDGSLADLGAVIFLAPGHQIARYLDQDFPERRDFFGSMQLTSLNGEPFIAVGLSQNQTLFTAIPIVSR